MRFSVSRTLLRCCLAITFGVMFGCQRTDRGETPAVLPVAGFERSFSEQLDAGRAAEGHRVELSTPITDDDLASNLRVTASGINTADEWLEELILDGGEVSDVGAAVIANLPSLRHLRLRHSPISDQGLRELANCETLQILNLPHSDLTDHGLESLRSLPDLRLLRLGGERFSGEAADQIARLETLRQLHLIGVPIDDRGLRKLARLPKLQSLYLDGSVVSEAGWDWLFATHPKLHVHVNSKHLDHDPNSDGPHL